MFVLAVNVIMSEALSPMIVAVLPELPPASNLSVIINVVDVCPILRHDLTYPFADGEHAKCVWNL